MAKPNDHPLGKEFFADKPKVVQMKEPEPGAPLPLPEFPKLTGPLDDLVRGITSDLQYEYKALCALVYLGVKISGHCRLASDPYLQPRFYGCMIGPPNNGKTPADKEVRRALAPVLDDDVHFEYSIDSGPALVEALAEHPRFVLAPDELGDQFEKARHTPGGHNSLFGEFLRLYESNSTGRRVLKKNGTPISVTDAHFGMIGGATSSRFDCMWSGTAGASTGLQSRFVLAYSEESMPALRSPNRDSIIEVAVDALKENLQGEWLNVRMSGDAQDAISSWSEKMNLAEIPRVLDMAKRFALALAVSRRNPEIDGDLMNRGLKFAEYQIAVHQKLMPMDSHGWTQAFENRILAFFKRNKQATERDLRRSLSPERYPGGYGAFQQACRNLVMTEKLVVVGKTSKDKAIWELD